MILTRAAVVKIEVPTKCIKHHNLMGSLCECLELTDPLTHQSQLCTADSSIGYERKHNTAKVMNITQKHGMEIRDSFYLQEHEDACSSHILQYSLPGDFYQLGPEIVTALLYHFR